MRAKPAALVADDEPAMLDLLRQELFDLGCECTCVRNGLEATFAVKESTFDLILLDMGMPVMNGLQACREIRMIEKSRHTPILFVTAIDRVEQIVKGFEAGANDYITKPFNTLELKARVRTQLRLSHTYKELADLEKRRSLTTLTAGLCHEVLNPLQIITGHLSIMEGSPEQAPYSDRIRAMLRGASRIHHILTLLHAYATETPEGFKPADLNTLIEQSLDLTRPLLENRKLTVTQNLATGLPLIKANINRLTQVFVQLLTNVAQYVSENGWVRIATGQDQRNVVAVIVDSGPGMSQLELDQIFDPFFTKKQVWQSPGLGLSVAQRIVTDHGGWLEVSSNPRAGSEFRVALPIPQGGW